MPNMGDGGPLITSMPSMADSTVRTCPCMFPLAEKFHPMVTLGQARSRLKDYTRSGWLSVMLQEALKVSRQVPTVRKDRSSSPLKQSLPLAPRPPRR